jgi:hypothetical protein
MKVTHKSDYRERRKREYPPLEDLADALYWQQQGDGSKLAAYFGKCNEVKRRFPKPVKAPG